MEPENKGKTLWELLMQRVHGHATGNGNGEGIAFENPLDLRVGSPVKMAFSNGPELAGYDFTVKEIHEYTRRLGTKEFRFTDYELRGVSTKSFDAADAIVARLRVVPNDAGAHDALLLRVHDEFAFAETFLAVVRDDSGLLEVTEDKTGQPELFTRINDVRGPYEAVVLVVSETTANGRAATGKASPIKIEYWDYSRQAPLGGGKTFQEFIFVELNSDTGWFQIWRGREYFS
jgi:hypothetical protein